MRIGRKEFLKLIIGCTLSVCLPMSAYANRCQHLSVEDAFNQAEMVFAGRLDSAQLQESKEESKKKLYQLNFTLLKLWKGRVEPLNVTYSAMNYNELPFQKDRNYLLFLSQHNKRKDGYMVWYCTPREDIGYQDGYTITMLLDQLASSNDELSSVRTPKNTFVGEGFGVTEAEALEQFKKDNPRIDHIQSQGQ